MLLQTVAALQAQVDALQGLQAQVDALQGLQSEVDALEACIIICPTDESGRQVSDEGGRQLFPQPAPQ